MPRQKGTPSTPQPVICEIVEKHRAGISLKTLSAEYEKSFKTVKNMYTGENNKLLKFNIPNASIWHYSLDVKTRKPL